MQKAPKQNMWKFAHDKKLSSQENVLFRLIKKQLINISEQNFSHKYKFYFD